MNLRVEDALAYLELVKKRYSTEKEVYTKFLDIMKSFKAAQIDTPGVIREVKTLFHGHNDLILGFNTFLPPDYKITLNDPPTTAEPPRTNSGRRARTKKPTAKLRGNITKPASTRTRAADPGAGGKNEQEFDTAINYVTKIKNRFREQPKIYNRFLNILHTYQKEQRHIKHVRALVWDGELREWLASVFVLCVDVSWPRFLSCRRFVCMGCFVFFLVCVYTGVRRGIRIVSRRARSVEGIHVLSPRCSPRGGPGSIRGHGCQAWTAIEKRKR